MVISNNKNAYALERATKAGIPNCCISPKDYEDRAAWSRKMIKNIAMAGFFSSDRTIAQYNDDIWHLD